MPGEFGRSRNRPLWQLVPFTTESRTQPTPQTQLAFDLPNGSPGPLRSPPARPGLRPALYVRDAQTAARAAGSTAAASRARKPALSPRARGPPRLTVRTSPRQASSSRPDVREGASLYVATGSLLPEADVLGGQVEAEVRAPLPTPPFPDPNADRIAPAEQDRHFGRAGRHGRARERVPAAPAHRLPSSVPSPGGCTTCERAQPHLRGRHARACRRRRMFRALGGHGVGGGRRWRRHRHDPRGGGRSAPGCGSRRRLCGVWRRLRSPSGVHLPPSLHRL